MSDDLSRDDLAKLDWLTNERLKLRGPLRADILALRNMSPEGGLVDAGFVQRFGETYDVTLDGWLRSAKGESLQVALDNIIRWIHASIDDNPYSPALNWTKAKEFLALSDDDFPLYLTALQAGEFNLATWSQLGNDFGLRQPQGDALLELMQLQTIDDVLQRVHRIRAARNAVRTSWATPPAGSPRSSMGDAEGAPRSGAQEPPNVPSREFEFDVALSFAGEDRSHADALAAILRDEGVRVFYDRYEQATLWGKDLYQHLQTIYRDRAAYCVIFASQSYAAKLWTKHELRQAQERAFRESREYLLPLRLDDTKIPGVPETTGYLDLRQIGLRAVAALLLEKVFGSARANANWDSEFADDPAWDGSMILQNGVEMASFWPERIATAQARPQYAIAITMKRIPYGSEEHDWGAEARPCHDCGVTKGQFHVPGCDVEQCPNCGEQALACGCDKEAVES